YCSDKVAQANYVRMLEEHDIAVVIADTLIDQHFLPYLEMRSSREYKFQRVDADISSHLLDKPSASIIDPTDQKTGDVKLNDLFRKFLPSDKIKLRIETFKSSKVPAMLLVDENRRRFKEMSKSAPF